MPNQLIGEYDMVFALSESKINAELRQLRVRGAIEPTWKFLTNVNSQGILHLHESGAVRVRQPWEWMKDGTDPFENTPSDHDWLAGKGDIRSKYQVKMDAKLDAPTIHLLPDRHHELLLKVNINSGIISYIEGDSVQQIKFDKCVYAFLVPVAQVRIDAEKMYFAGEDALKQLREEKLTDHDFTVDSIMLNFARADVASFIPSESMLPKAAGLEDKLRVAVSNYFKDLSNNKKNPYVLGYALKKKNLSPRDKALLTPTAISFSTSFSPQQRCSAFNFLMLTDNQPFPKGEFAGKVKASLMEYAQDTSATVSGVIAIDYATFERTYLDALHKIVIDNFESAFRSHPEFASFYQHHKILNSYNTYFEFAKPNLSMTMTLNRADVAHRIDDKTGDQYLAVEYIIGAWGNVHAELEQKVFHVISAGTVGVDQTFSTSGQYPVNNQVGRLGRLTLQIRASNEGKLSIGTEYEPPSIGTDTEKPYTSKSIDDVWLVVSKLLSPFGVVGAIINFLNDDSGKSIVNFKNNPFDQVTLSSFDNFSSRVILPGSNVYTFKNVGMVGSRNNGNCYIKFDIAYAVATA